MFLCRIPITKRKVSDSESRTVLSSSGQVWRVKLRSQPLPLQFCTCRDRNFVVSSVQRLFFFTLLFLSHANTEHAPKTRFKRPNANSVSSVAMNKANYSTIMKIYQLKTPFISIKSSAPVINSTIEWTNHHKYVHDNILADQVPL
jgi:hypothetical protein